MKAIWNRTGEIVEIIRELKNQKLVPRNMKSDFLQDYGLPIQQSIEDEQMKKWPPMVE